MLADVEILLELQHVDHRPAIRAFHPEAFRHVFTSIKGAQAGFAENAHGIGKLLGGASRRGGGLVGAKLAAGMAGDNPLLKDLHAARGIFRIAIVPERQQNLPRK
jgi:hypothetical protein